MSDLLHRVASDDGARRPPDGEDRDQRDREWADMLRDRARSAEQEAAVLRRTLSERDRNIETLGWCMLGLVGLATLCVGFIAVPMTVRWFGERGYGLSYEPPAFEPILPAPPSGPALPPRPPPAPSRPSPSSAPEPAWHMPSLPPGWQR